MGSGRLAGGMSRANKLWKGSTEKIIGRKMEGKPQRSGQATGAGTLWKPSP